MERIMSGCERFRDETERYIAGEASSSDLEALKEHSESCEDCRIVLELHEDLKGMASGVPEPSEAHFREMRAAVLRQVDIGARTQKTRVTSGGRGFWARLFPSPVFSAATAALLAIVLLGGGFFIGRASAPQEGFTEDALLTEINKQASLSKGLDGYWDSPFSFSNVRAKKREGGYMAMSFDVTHHVDLDMKMGSPLVNEVLLHAILDSPNVGSRFTAMELAQESADPNLTEALVFTLLNDPALPVRLSALNILKGHASDPAVRDALLTTVGQDPSVQMRFLALECLAGQQVEPDAIRRAVGDSPDDAGRAVLERANQLF
jgi:hypothetical protein